MRSTTTNAKHEGSMTTSYGGLLSRVSSACASRPKLILVVWVLIAVLLAIFGRGGASSLETSDILIDGTKSSNAIELEKSHFGESQSLAVLLDGNPAQVNRYGPRAVKRLDRLQGVSVLSPWSPNAPDTLRPKKGQALLVLQVGRAYDITGKVTVPAVRKQLRDLLPESMNSYITGNAAIANELNRVGFNAAKESEKVAAPLLIIILLLVFRSPVAAFIPGVLGFAVIICGGGVVSILSRLIAVDAMATLMMSMMGLALGVDYSLLIVSRFREELAAGHSKDEALERTASTAGRTVMFAGLILIFAMLAALLIAPGNMMTSSTVGVMGATIIAMAGAATLLPALLFIFAPYLERWRLGRKSSKAPVSHIIKRLIRKPAVATVAILIPLLALSTSAFGLELGAPAVNALPDGNSFRAEYEEIKKEIGGGWSALFTVIAVSKDGPITEKRRLAKLDKFQKKVARQEGVGTVLGPAGLNKQSKKLQRAADNLSEQRKDLDKLEGGLGEAESGVGDLRKGLSEASSSADRLERGLNKSLGGTLELQSALNDSTAGSRKLKKSITEARDGAKKIATSAEEVERGSTQVMDASKDFSDELAAGKQDLEGLRQASADATNELALALAALDRTTAATKYDPEFAVAYERAATALGTLTGQHPKTGQRPESGYYGMESSIARATEQNIAASKEASNLASGATDLHGGVAELGKGTDSLLSGLSKIYTGSGSLTSGLEETREGTGDLNAGNHTLVGGANSLKEGASRLAGELGEGHTQSAGLQSGLEQMTSDVGQFNSSQASSGTAGQQEKTMKSGYFLLAGIDGGDVDDQESAAFALNWNEGGSASRIMVVPGGDDAVVEQVDAGPQDMRELNQLNKRLNRMVPSLARDLNADTAVGGRGPVLTDFIETANRTILPLIATLVVVALLLLTVVFRSPLLAVKAVVLNLLTLGAALGVLVLVSTGESPLIGGPGFLDPISLIGIITVVFALSIDYEVFLITRMREGYLLTGTADGAIRYGIDHTARVITGAAAIMIGVFFAFGLADFMTVRALGVGLSVAIFLDATVVRLILLPATMRLFGRANWWMPKWLDRLLPNVSVEGSAQ